MSERNANAVHCPHSNLGNHSISKTPLLMALGVNIGLGTDGVAGTGRGADMSAVVSPANSFRFFDLKVLELICLPSADHSEFDSDRK